MMDQINISNRAVDHALTIFPGIRDNLNDIPKGYATLMGITHAPGVHRFGHCVILLKTRTGQPKFYDPTTGYTDEFTNEILTQTGLGHPGAKISILKARARGNGDYQLKFGVPRTGASGPYGIERIQKRSSDGRSFPVLFPININTKLERATTRRGGPKENIRQMLNDCCLCVLETFLYPTDRENTKSVLAGTHPIEITQYFDQLYPEWAFDFNPQPVHTTGGGKRKRRLASLRRTRKKKTWSHK
jgi:hypothetical protein